MISILCDTPDKVTLGELIPFQGNLKKRTTGDIKSLAGSIQSEGLIMPFAVWKDNTGRNILLDGHGRLAALTELALTDTDVASQQFPVLYITADTEDEARKHLLQITSSYGRFNKQGVIKFCATIPEYKAPAINKYVHNKKVKRETVEHKTTAIIRIEVPADKEAEVRDLLMQVSYIKVL